MSSEEKIIITTEEISVDELKGRDKVIYDYAYLKGKAEAIDFNKYGIVRSFLHVGVFVGFSIFIAILLRGCNY